MAKETFTRLTDDLDGSEAVEEISFALRGVEYEIDLNAKNAAALDKALEKYVAAARKVARGRAAAAPSRRTRPAATGKEDLAGLRAWARANGFEVSERGRIPAAVREAYAEANG